MGGGGAGFAGVAPSSFQRPSLLQQIRISADINAIIRVLFPLAQHLVRPRPEGTPRSMQANGVLEELETMADLEAERNAVVQWAEDNADKTFLLPAFSMFTVEAFNDMLGWLGVSGCSYSDVAHSDEEESFSGKSRTELFGGFLEGSCKWGAAETEAQAMS